ncbi:putative lipase 8 precursor [Talaromyces proteolyticus]|uniref:Lipase 8 n=1 Tax=Talaromyces proteolyticus TaxID=1131652 RepID=A0AAD4KYQ6_9EURO|nr:putative lipase 8 precursor [Talaromyces proteolyticus]KAH8703990.1 putative lipase 8 precursor [Talaromyces proteolyticus]
MHTLRTAFTFLAGSLLFIPTLSIQSSEQLGTFQSRTAAPLPPSQDPWYTAPEQSILFSSAPGTILRIRPDPFHLYASLGVNISTASYNILYRTTDANNLPSFAVTTLFIPAGDTETFHPSQGSPSLLSYQIPYNSPWVDSSPSYTLSTNTNSTFPDIVAGLAQGWYVSVPDHEGPNATFAIGVEEGHAVLDSLRAVTQSSLSPAVSKENGYSSDHKHIDWKIGLWGYSGGSIASEFAAEIQASYAPDIQIAGVAIGGLPTPLNAVFEAVNKSPYAGLIPLGLWGAANAYPYVGDYLTSRLTPGAKETGVFTKARNMSVFEAFSVYNGSDIFSYFIGGKDDVLSSPITTFIFETQSTMGRHGLPTMPIFVYKAVADLLAPIQYVDSLIGQYCNYSNVTEGKGVKILYERNTIGGHVAEEINQDVNAVRFLAKALSGRLGAGWPNGKGHGCVVRNVTVGNDTSPDW